MVRALLAPLLDRVVPRSPRHPTSDGIVKPPFSRAIRRSRCWRRSWCTEFSMARGTTRPIRSISSIRYPIFVMASRAAVDVCAGGGASPRHVILSEAKDLLLVREQSRSFATPQDDRVVRPPPAACQYRKSRLIFTTNARFLRPRTVVGEARRSPVMSRSSV